MTHQKLAGRIKAKFGSIANFCSLAKLDYAKTRRFLARKPKNITESEAKRIGYYQTKYQETLNPAGLGLEITETERLDIYLAIKAQHGSQKKFCEKHPQWDYRFVTDITSNKKVRASRKTLEVIKLMNFLNV